MYTFVLFLPLSWGRSCLHAREVSVAAGSSQTPHLHSNRPACLLLHKSEAAAFFSLSSRAKLLCFSFYYTKQHVKLCPVCKNYALLTTLSAQRQVFFRTSKTSMVPTAHRPAEQTAHHL